jgi:formylglycine-generating enzyme required for sulfatase activity
MGRYALLIGISNYNNAGLNPLPSAVKDVDALQQVLLNPEIGGFADGDVTVLKDVEKGAIETAIYHLFANRKPDDLLLFYFSGHGVTDDRRDFYFSGLSTSKDALPPTAVSSFYVQSQMYNSRSQRQVAILDCCHSGAFPKGMKAKDVGTVDIKLGGEGQAILTAADSSQYAFEQEGFDLSLYTHFLVEGLKTGAADRDEDGDVSVDELHVYVEGKVKSVNNSMSPKFFGQKEGHRIVLARAAQDDPKLRFRKEVEKVVKRSNGKISGVASKLLIEKSQGLNSLEVEAIISEVKRPYEEYDGKLKKYEQNLVDQIAEEFPFSEVVQVELEEYEKHLGLREADLREIKNRLITPKQAEYDLRLREQQLKEEAIQIQRQRELEKIQQRQAAEAENLKRQQEELTRQKEQERSQIEKLNSIKSQPERRKSTNSVRLISRRNLFGLIGLTGAGVFSAVMWERLKSNPVAIQTAKPTLVTAKSNIFNFEIVKVDKSGTVVKREKSQIESLIYNLTDKISLELVNIPAGKFMMGMPADDRKIALESLLKDGNKREDAERWLDRSTPIHEVKIPSFLMGKYAVTNAQWQAVMVTKPSEKSDVKFQGENQPVINVSWDNCKEFCKKLSERIKKNVRLPSEAEWEYACRAGTTAAFHFGETITFELVNYDGKYPYVDAPKGEYRQKTVDVNFDRFSPNAWGLYQMHGNVWEWCEDVWHENYNGAPTEGSAWLIGGEQTRRALRGGSWVSSAINCRSALRVGDDADVSYNDFGFRVVVA